MVGWQEAIEMRRSQLDLVTLGTLQARSAPGRLGWLDGGLPGQIEEGVIHGSIVAAARRLGKILGGNLHSLSVVLLVLDVVVE